MLLVLCTVDYKSATEEAKVFMRRKKEDLYCRWGSKTGLIFVVVLVITNYTTIIVNISHNELMSMENYMVVLKPRYHAFLHDINLSLVRH